MKIVVKIGGAQLVDPQARASIAASIAAAVHSGGHQVVVVHGGGQQLKQLTDRLGMPAPKTVRGLRVTDAATAEAAVMVLGGQVNRALVLAIQRARGNAVGLTGADGGLLSVRPLDPALGRVGAVETVDPTILRALTASLQVPVVASVAPLDPRFVDGAHPDAGADAFYNVNADHVVAPLARSFAADAVLFLTDVSGVRDAQGNTCRQLDRAATQELITSGVVRGGMIPKVETAVDVAEACPRARVCIASAVPKDSLQQALRDGTGTVFSSTPLQERGAFDG